MVATTESDCPRPMLTFAVPEVSVQLTAAACAEAAQSKARMHIAFFIRVSLFGTDGTWHTILTPPRQPE